MRVPSTQVMVPSFSDLVGLSRRIALTSYESPRLLNGQATTKCVNPECSLEILILILGQTRALLDYLYVLARPPDVMTSKEFVRFPPM